MTPIESQLRQELQEKNRQLQEITRQAAELQNQVAELEEAMGRIFSETVSYAR